MSGVARSSGLFHRTPELYQSGPFGGSDMSLVTAKTRQYATPDVGSHPTRRAPSRARGAESPAHCQRDPVEVLSTQPSFGPRPFARSSKGVSHLRQDSPIFRRVS